jgi:hypothetical protein
VEKTDSPYSHSVRVVDGEIYRQISTLARGMKCTEVLHYAPGSWSFNFQGSLHLNVQCPWRIAGERGILLGGDDDGQKFGLPATVDGAIEAMKLLSATHLEQIVIADATADICLEFNSGLRLELFNNSLGYEGWSCSTSSGIEIIGMGGGGTARVMPGLRKST